MITARVPVIIRPPADHHETGGVIQRSARAIVLGDVEQGAGNACAAQLRRHPESEQFTFIAPWY